MITIAIISTLTKSLKHLSSEKLVTSILIPKKVSLRRKKKLKISTVLYSVIIRITK